jgi:hypothetical protein
VEKHFQQFRAGHAQLEGFPFVGVRAERVSQLEVQRRGADLIRCQRVDVRPLQVESQVSGRRVSRVEKRALRIGQCGPTGVSRDRGGHREDGRQQNVRNRTGQ